MRARTLVALAAGGLVLAAIGVAFVLASDHEENKGAFLSLALTVGLSFLASGVIALWRRPDNRTGILLVAVAYFWFLGALVESSNDWIFTLGLLVNPLALGAFVHLLLAFPSGRLQGRRDAWLVAGTYTLVFVGSRGPAPGRGTARPGLPRVPERDCRRRQRDGLQRRRRDHRPGCARARHNRPRHRRRPLCQGPGRAPPSARPGARNRRARDGRPRARARRRRLRGGSLGAALLRLPRHIRARAGGVPRRCAAEPPRALRRGRPAARAQPRDAAARGTQGSPERPHARHRVLVARPRSLRLGRRKAAVGGRRQPQRHVRGARGTTDRRLPARPDAERRAGARRRRLRRGRPLARQRAPASRAALADRVPGDDRQHLPVTPLLARPRRPDREPEPRRAASERLRRSGGGALAPLLGHLRGARGTRRVERALPGGRALPRAGCVRAHLRQPRRRGVDDRLVDGAAERRQGQRPERDLRRARHHRAEEARARAGGGARLCEHGRQHDPDLPHRRVGRRHGERLRPQPSVRADARLDA